MHTFTPLSLFLAGSLQFTIRDLTLYDTTLLPPSGVTYTSNKKCKAQLSWVIPVDPCMQYKFCWDSTTFANVYPPQFKDQGYILLQRPHSIQIGHLTRYNCRRRKRSISESLASHQCLPLSSYPISRVTVCIFMINLTISQQDNNATNS